MCDSLSSYASRRPRILLPDRAGRSDGEGGAGMVGRGGSGRCEYVGRAARGHIASSEPNANSPGATGHAHHGRGPLPTWRSRTRRAQVPRPVRFGSLRWGACRGRARGIGDQQGPGGRRDWGEGPGPPPLSLCPPCPPTRSSRLEGKKRRCSLSRSACSAHGSYLWSPRGRPLRGHLSFLLLRKPPSQLPASRTGGARTPGQGAGLAVGDM